MTKRQTRPTCDALADLYLRRHAFPTRQSRDAQERSLRRALGEWGGSTPSEITPDDVLCYVDRRRDDGVCDATIKRELGAFVTALTFAARMRRISPAEIPVIPQLQDKGVRVVYMTRAQRRVFEERLAGAPLEIRAFGMIGLIFGARAGAILDLTADRVGAHIDFRVPGVAETRKRRSVNSVPPAIRPLLAELKLPFPPDTAKRFARWCERQDWPEGFPRVTPHVLRHTCATLMLEKGASLWDVSKWLNESYTTIERHYGHLTSDSQDRLAAIAAE